MDINSTIQSVTSWINEMSGGNEFLAAAMGAAMIAGITYLCKDIPLKGWRLFLKHTTTSMTLSSCHESYHLITRWLASQGVPDRLRALRIENGKWGQGASNKGIGTGSHLIWFRKRPLRIHLSIKEGSGRDMDISEMMLTKFGRSHKLFNEMLEEAVSFEQNKNSNEDTIPVYSYSYVKEAIYYCKRVSKRPLSSVFTSGDTKKKAVEAITRFLSKEEWYKSNGIPWHLGILIHGMPGTGKTSLVRALASHFNRKLLIVRSTSITSLADVLHDAPDDCLIVIEDIDSSKSVQSRFGMPERDFSGGIPEIEDIRRALKEAGHNIGEPSEMTAGKSFGVFPPLRPRKEKGPEDVQDYQELSRDVGISGVLNALDGILSPEGSIVIMTTNRPEILDAALLRPGRVDLKLEVGYLDLKALLEMLTSLYPDCEIDSRGLRLVTEDLTGAIVQQAVLDGEPAEAILDKHTKKEPGTQVYKIEEKEKEDGRNTRATGVDQDSTGIQMLGM